MIYNQLQSPENSTLSTPILLLIWCNGTPQTHKIYILLLNLLQNRKSVQDTNNVFGLDCEARLRGLQK